MRTTPNTRTAPVPVSDGKTAEPTASVQAANARQNPRVAPAPGLREALNTLLTLSSSDSLTALHNGRYKFDTEMHRAYLALQNLPAGPQRQEAVAATQRLLNTTLTGLKIEQLRHGVSLKKWLRQLGNLASPVHATQDDVRLSTHAGARARARAPELHAAFSGEKMGANAGLAPQAGAFGAADGVPAAPLFVHQLPPTWLKDAAQSGILGNEKLHLSEGVNKIYMPMYFDPRNKQLKHMRTSLLRLGEDDVLVMASMTAQGTYGKLRPAVSLRTGEQLMVKEFRKRSVRQGDGKHMMLSRLMRHRTAAPGDEQSLVKMQRDIAQEYTALSHFGGVTKPRGIVQTQACSYIVMKAMDGDLVDTCKGLTQQQRSDLARTLLVPLAAQVGVLHSADLLHLDVKLENMLVHYESAVVAISDFGTMRRVPSDTYGIGVHHNPSTYPSPEMLMPNLTLAPDGLRMVREQGYRAYLTDKTDVWALGIAIAEMLAAGAHKGEAAPFGHQNFDAQAYVDWHNALPHTIYGLNLSALHVDSDNRFSRYFARCSASDDLLTHYLLSVVLAPNPHKRPHLEDIVQHWPQIDSSTADIAARRTRVRGLFAAKKEELKDSEGTRVMNGLAKIRHALVPGL